MKLIQQHLKKIQLDNKMNYTLSRHKKDNDMIEATTTSVALSRPLTWLAFVVHTDLIDPDILAMIDEQGSIDIHFEVIEDE